MHTPFLTKALGLAAPLCLTLAAGALAETAVVFRTSDNVGGAGTDSNIYVKFHGPKGASKRYRLQDHMSGNILEKGDYDTFMFSDDIGAGVTRVELESDGRYSGSDWHLAEIKTFTSPPGTTTKIGFLAVPTAAVAAKNYEDGSKVSSAVAAKVVTSTFSYDDWITGEESHPGTNPGSVKRGISMNRYEPLARANGAPDINAAKIYMVMWSDGMDANQNVPVSLSHTFTRSDSMTLTTDKTNAVSTSAEIGVKWQQHKEGKGWTVEGKLSAEYDWVSSKVDEKSWTTTGSTTNEDK